MRTLNRASGFATVALDLARMTDVALARARLRVVRERPALIVLNFHAVVREADDLRAHVIAPRWCLTVGEVGRCIEYFVNRGYIAVSPRDIVDGLGDDGRYVMFTFDDGYFNNSYVLPLLEKTGIPALFAITTDAVVSGRSFWWDVLYRERTKGGVAPARIEAEAAPLMRESAEAIERYLVLRFGPAALDPTGDVDRPFSPAELRAFASHPCVFLANHTAGHEWLPGCSAPSVERTLRRAQDYLEEVAAVQALAVVYPFGDASAEAVSVARRLGLHLGFTTRMAKQVVPIDGADEARMELPRFAISGDGALKQCERARFDWRPTAQLRAAVRNLFSG